MPKINVMQVIHDLNFGGMQRVVADLCLHVDPSRYRMCVCCLEELGPNAEELTKKGIPVFLVKKNAGLDYLLPIRLRRLFIDQTIQIVHTHGINPFFYGALGSKLARVPVTIQTDHARGIFPVSKKEMVSERILSWFVDCIVAVSDGVKDDLVNFENINPKKIHVIYNGIDASKYRITIDQWKKREELGITNSDIIIGVGVRLSEQKGISYLIEALKILDAFIPKVKLLIVGDGELREDLEKLSAECGIADKVIFTGFRSDIHELLQIIDVYALPSLWEGHPLVLLEAMAAGKPIVATDVSGNRETVDHGRTGLLVPPKRPKELANSLKELLNNEELRNQMGQMSYKTFKDKFTLEKTIKEYQHLYEQFLNLR